MLKGNLITVCPDIMYEIRKQYNLEKTADLDEAIRILDDWVKEQKHFLKHDFSKHYLENTLIASKGSIERSKARLDKICTLRTALPKYFEMCNAKQDLKDLFNNCYIVTMPMFAENYSKLSIVKYFGSNVGPDFLLNLYRYIIIFGEYLKAHDYFNSSILVFDYQDFNIMEIVQNIKVNETFEASSIFMEGFGLRIVNMHLISPSNLVGTLAKVLQQALPKKIGERIVVHKTVESLHDYISKDILPQEYGGKDKSIKELHENWLDELSSEKHIEYMKMMRSAGIDEKLRPIDQQTNEELLGVPGSFRNLIVD